MMTEEEWAFEVERRRRRMLVWAPLVVVGLAVLVGVSVGSDGGSGWVGALVGALVGAAIVGLVYATRARRID